MQGAASASILSFAAWEASTELNGCCSGTAAFMALSMSAAEPLKVVMASCLAALQEAPCEKVSIRSLASILCSRSCGETCRQPEFNDDDPRTTVREMHGSRANRNCKKEEDPSN